MGKIKHGHSRGGKRSKTFRIWKAMTDRCNNKNVPYFFNYGGRGIKVCSRWLKFENFLADMGICPEGFSIERVNNDGNYDPENCKWIPRSEQAKNTRRSVFLEFNGEKMIVADWARRLGISQHLIKDRLRKLGWSPAEALGFIPRFKK